MVAPRGAALPRAGQRRVAGLLQEGTMPGTLAGDARRARRAAAPPAAGSWTDEHGFVERDLRWTGEDAHQRALRMARGERRRLCPGGEGGAVLPGGMADVFAGVIALEQQEADEAGHFFEIRLARCPALLELALAARHDRKAIHRDKHGTPRTR